MDTCSYICIVLSIICTTQISLSHSKDKPALASSVRHSTIDDEKKSPAGYIVTAGGYDGSYYLQNSYVLNLTSGLWSPLPDLPYPSVGLAMVANRGQIYAIGGYQERNSNKTYYLSMTHNTWIPSSPAKYNYGTTAAVSLKNSIYLVGSVDSAPNLFQVQVCNGVWSTLPSSLLPHAHGSATVLDGNIYACAGDNASNLCEFYNPTNKTWTVLPPMGIPRSRPSVVGLNGFLYVIGGAASGFNERYDPTTSKWSFFQSTINNPLSWTAAVTDGHYIYVIGGFTGSYTDTVEIYMPDLNIWQSILRYPKAAGYIGAVYVAEMPVN